MEEVPVLNEKSIKKLLQAFAKKVSENETQRTLHKEEPELFMESEVNLDESIKTLKELTDYPAHYPLLVSSGTLSLLSALLLHENIDIVLDVVDLINELTDPDLILSEQNAIVLIEEILKEKIEVDMIGVLHRLDEGILEEQEGIIKILLFLENLMEVVPNAVQSSLRDLAMNSNSSSNSFSLIRWLLSRISVGPSVNSLRKVMDAVRGTNSQKDKSSNPNDSPLTASPVKAETIWHYSAELLAIIVSSFDVVVGSLESSEETDNKNWTGTNEVIKEGGVETILVMLAQFRKRKLQQKQQAASSSSTSSASSANITLSMEEEEVVENCVDVLCYCLLHAEGKKQFEAQQGIDLVLLLIKSLPMFIPSMLKVIQLSTVQSPSMCARLVERGGLKILFGWWMQKCALTESIKHRSTNIQQDESVMTIFYNLIRLLSGINYLRFIAKFAENNYEKLGRLIMFHKLYYENVMDVREKMTEEEKKKRKRSRWLKKKAQKMAKRKVTEGDDKQHESDFESSDESDESEEIDLTKDEDDNEEEPFSVRLHDVSFEAGFLCLQLTDAIIAILLTFTPRRKRSLLASGAKAAEEQPQLQEEEDEEEALQKDISSILQEACFNPTVIEEDTEKDAQKQKEDKTQSSSLVGKQLIEVLIEYRNEIASDTQDEKGKDGEDAKQGGSSNEEKRHDSFLSSKREAKHAEEERNMISGLIDKLKHIQQNYQEKNENEEVS